MTFAAYSLGLMEKILEARTWLNHPFSPPLVLEIMNPVYSPGSSGVPYANAKGIGYPGKQVEFCFYYWTLNTFCPCSINIYGGCAG